jgi:hypothetical protein
MRDLAEVRSVDLTLDGQRYQLRTELQGSAATASAAAGVRPPRLVTALAAGPPDPVRAAPV